jgi:predicted Zn-dependent protease
MTALAKVFYRMKPLEPPDNFHLDAAEGWIGLGDYAAANDELKQIAETNCAHPDVLRVRWRIYAHAGKWDACLGIATALTTQTPERPFGWIYHAYTLHQLGWTKEAKDLLLFALNAFGSNAAFPYHLARYCCGLGQIDEAKQWLGKALLVPADMKEVKRLRKLALEDPDLEPLRGMP